MSASATSRRIRAHDWVLADLGSGLILGVVLEDRGPLGPAGERILRFAWTPSQGEEPLEFEISESDVRPAIARLEWMRVQAGMDECSDSHRSAARGADVFAEIRAGKARVDNAVVAALERGDPQDFRLVHRYCVEDLGAAALAARREWANSGSVPHVNPTLTRLPTMIEFESRPDRAWLTSETPLLSWHSKLVDALTQLYASPWDDLATGSRMVSIIGSCADMAAWTRTTQLVGE